MSDQVDALEAEMERAFIIMERVRKIASWGRREWTIFILGGISSLGIYAFIQWSLWTWQIMISAGVIP